MSGPERADPVGGARRRRELLVSKGWVQAVVLVILFGFFVLGLLAYRTYEAKPPIPDRVVDPQGRSLYTGEGRPGGPAGVPAQRADGVRLGLRPRRLPRARLHRRLPAPRVELRQAQYGGARSDRAAQRTIEDFRTNRYDEGTGTLTLTAPQAAAHRRLVGYYSRFFSEPTTEARAAPERDHRSAGSCAQLTAFFGWTAWAGVGGAAGPQLLLHEQLAARAARGQQADGERGRLERAVADRAARRHRHPVRRLRPLAASSAGTGASRPRCPSARRATWRSRPPSAHARGSSS